MMWRARIADGKQDLLEAHHSDSPMTMLHPMLRREMRERRRRFEFPRLHSNHEAPFREPSQTCFFLSNLIAIENP